MPQPLIAIVGRPNVGKSTLFNRIVGHRDAIVHDLPGVTRDRHYASTDWGGKNFSIVDTGGYVPTSVDVIEIAIREQAEIAIEEADRVIFVVDGVSGLLPTDFDIAGVLRRAQKKVLLVVNKVDNEQREPLLAEFYKLGLGDPVPASALLGRSIGDLLDRMTEGMAIKQNPDEDSRLKLAIVGRPNVGKSSLVNALLQQERNIVTDIPGTTRDPIDAILKYHGEEILLIDTAGLRRKSKVQESVEFYSTVRTFKSIERCDVAMVLIDARDGLEHQDLRIIEWTLQRRRACILVINKWDLIEKDDRTARQFERMLRERLRMYDYLPMIFISVHEKQRVYKAVELARTVNTEQLKRISTSELNERLIPDILARPPHSSSGKEIKIKYVSQVKTKPPVFAFFCNDPKLIDENFQRYLENRIRHHFAFTGVPVVLSFKKK